MLKNPLMWRVLSGSLFAAAFVWAAVTFFDADAQVVWAFFLMSLLLVAAMAVAGLLLAPLVKLAKRRRRRLLSRLDQAGKPGG